MNSQKTAYNSGYEVSLPSGRSTQIALPLVEQLLISEKRYTQCHGYGMRSLALTIGITRVILKE